MYQFIIVELQDGDNLMGTPNITSTYSLDYLENNIGKRAPAFMDVIGKGDDGKLYLQTESGWFEIEPSFSKSETEHLYHDQISADPDGVGDLIYANAEGEDLMVVSTAEYLVENGEETSNKAKIDISLGTTVEANYALDINQDGIQDFGYLNMSIKPDPETGVANITSRGTVLIFPRP